MKVIRLSTLIIGSTIFSLLNGCVTSAPPSPLPTALTQQIHNTGDLSSPYVVIVAQQYLKNLGYYAGPVDGKVGQKTTQAIRQFELSNGLFADGSFDLISLSKLESQVISLNSPPPQPFDWSTLIQAGHSSSTQNDQMIDQSSTGLPHTNSNAVFPSTLEANQVIQSSQIRDADNSAAELQNISGNMLVAANSIGVNSERLNRLHTSTSRFKSLLGAADNINQSVQTLNSQSAGAQNQHRENTPAVASQYAAPIPQTRLSREQRQEIQRQLTLLGLYNGKIDGIIGQQTKLAIGTFESLLGMPLSGKASLALTSSLYSAIDRLKSGQSL